MNFDGKVARYWRWYVHDQNCATIQSWEFKGRVPSSSDASCSVDTTSDGEATSDDTGIWNFSLRGTTGTEEVQIIDGDNTVTQTLSTEFVEFTAQSSQITIEHMNDGQENGQSRDVRFESTSSVIIDHANLQTWDCDNNNSTLPALAACIT
jgi:hypothetical protein